MARRQKFPDYNKKMCRKNYAQNKDARCERVRQYYAARRQEKIQYQVDYERRRCSEDVNYRLRVLLRHRVAAAIRREGGKKSRHTMILVGCDIPFLRRYIEAQFSAGMTWDNWGKGPGKWNIDHVIPCAAHDLTDPEQQRACFHFSNLQPLWAEDNIRKGTRYNGVWHHKVCQVK